MKIVKRRILDLDKKVLDIKLLIRKANEKFEKQAIDNKRSKLMGGV